MNRARTPWVKIVGVLIGAWLLLILLVFIAQRLVVAS